METFLALWADLYLQKSKHFLREVPQDCKIHCRKTSNTEYHILVHWVLHCLPENDLFMQGYQSSK